MVTGDDIKRKRHERRMVRRVMTNILKRHHVDHLWLEVWSNYGPGTACEIGFKIDITITLVFDGAEVYVAARKLSQPMPLPGFGFTINLAQPDSIDKLVALMHEVKNSVPVR